jgi:NAD(P)H dehydrogenase (quinone)
MDKNNVEILLLYYSRSGHTEKLARFAARGVEQAGAQARLRTVPAVATTNSESGAALVSKADLSECAGLLRR